VGKGRGNQKEIQMPIGQEEEKGAQKNSRRRRSCLPRLVRRGAETPGIKKKIKQQGEFVGLDPGPNL